MRIVFLLILFLPASRSVAWVQSDTVVVLDEIHVEAARSMEVDRQAPFSLFLLERRPAEAATDPAYSLEDITRSIPGLWVASRDHLALGERVSLRGASARSPFGTRGIQIVADGIPLTAPDGQAMSEIIDPAMVRRLEVIRGPASTFWGNASAGALHFTSVSPEDEPTVILHTGSFGNFYAGASGATSGEGWNASGYASHLAHQGYREHADGVMNRGGLRLEHEIGPSSLLRVVAAAAWQDANSPGSLTLDEWTDDAATANPSYVRTASGKTSTQGQAGLFWTHGFESSMLEVGAYGILREMVNPLPYAVIDLSRTVTGVRANFIQRTGNLEVSFGADAAFQADGRLNFDNESGTAGDVATLDQREQVTSAGAIVHARYRPTAAIQISTGLRGDILGYSLADHLHEDSEHDGSRTFQALSPSIGISVAMANLMFYGSLATAFETPTTTELVNRPDGRHGFHTGLDPERTISLEAGVRGALGSSIYVDGAAFWASIQNRMLSYQTDDGGAQTFFRNADTGHHVGAEVFLLVDLLRNLELSTSYSLIHATFVDSDDETRKLPGVPGHFGSAEMAYRPGDWVIRAQVDAASGMYGDDANNVEVDGFVTIDVGIGHENIPAGPAVVRPFLRLENLLDARYSRSLVVNANADRFYEPSPGRSLQAGLTISF